MIVIPKILFDSMIEVEKRHRTGQSSECLHVPDFVLHAVNKQCDRKFTREDMKARSAVYEVVTLYLGQNFNVLPTMQQMVFTWYSSQIVNAAECVRRAQEVDMELQLRLP